MANYIGGVNTFCPYYDHEARFSITCEGMCGEKAGIRKFGSEQNKKAWQHAYCFAVKYEKCPYARLLGGKYK